MTTLLIVSATGSWKILPGNELRRIALGISDELVLTPDPGTSRSELVLTPDPMDPGSPKDI